MIIPLRHRSRVLAMAAIASLWFLATPATAQATGAHYVAFGDSIAANPTWQDQFEKRPDSPCRTSPDSYPVHVAREFPSFFNGSCSGAKMTTYPGERGTFSEELGQTIDRAVADQAIGTGTKVITVTMGANDKWPNAQHFGYYPGGSHITTDEYVGRMQPHITRLKQLAPNARIVLVGYPAFVESDGKFCPVNVDNNNGLPVRMELPDPTLKVHFDQLNHAMAQAADHFTVDFVDMTEPFVGHTTCAPTGQRWVTTVVNNPDERLLPMHMTAEGAQAQARIITDFLRR